VAKGGDIYRNLKLSNMKKLISLILCLGFLLIFSGTGQAEYICLTSGNPYGKCVKEHDGDHCRKNAESGTVCSGGSATDQEQ